MPKTKGMTSIEVAVLVGIILVVAAAVGWYVYSTFLANTAANPQVSINDVRFYNNGTLILVITNQGPARAEVRSIEFGGRIIRVDEVINVGEVKEIRVNVGFGTWTGILVSGRVILAHGGSIPFVARALRS